jgi:hypothetical protein
MTIFYVPLYDLWAMGFAVAVAIGIFALLFAIPLTMLWAAMQGVGYAWRFTKHTGGALRAHGHAPRHTTGGIVRSGRT